jgi:hypothetical protein
VYESWMIFMKIWLFHPVCRLFYLVCAVSRSEILHQFCVSFLVWSDDFVSLLPIFLGWFSCSLQRALHWPVHFPHGVLARSSHHSSSGVCLPGLEIFGSLFGSFGPCQFSSPVSFPAASPPVRSERVSFSQASAPADLCVERRAHFFWVRS